MTDRTEFRWGRAGLHAVLALVVTIAVTVTLALVFDVADPRRFGEGVGRFSLFMMLGAVGVSWLLQTGRKVAAGIAGGLLLALLVGLVILVTAVAPSRPEPLPTADLVRADSTLRHPTLGFSIPDPGDNLTSRPELAAAQFPSGPDARAWVYGDETTAEVVIVLLASEAAADAETFESFFSGVIRGQAGAISDASMKADERERSVRWDERRAHAYVVVAEAMHLRVDAFGLPGGEAMVLISAATQADRFEPLAAGVTLTGR